MVLPVFALYTRVLPGSTPTLIGVAMGIYGLTQALFQIPLGLLSDRWGRKPIIIFGLVLFILGSWVAAESHTIQQIIVGRALQGAGAIGSTVLALASDLTPEKQRTQTMAILGVTIGIAFVIAMIVGPWVNAAFQLSGIFILTAILGCIGLLIVRFGVPTPTPPGSVVNTPRKKDSLPWSTLLKNKEFLHLVFGIGALHAILTANFIAIPLLLNTYIHGAHRQTYFYTAVFVAAFIAILPLLRSAEIKQQVKPIFIGAVCTLLGAELVLPWTSAPFGVFAVLLFLFFTAFTLLEALLPSLVSKVAPKEKRGAAMGFYSTAQFFGIFLGGSIGGFLFHTFDLYGVFFFGAILSAFWSIWAFTLDIGQKK